MRWPRMPWRRSKSEAIEADEGGDMSWKDDEDYEDVEEGEETDAEGGEEEGGEPDPAVQAEISAAVQKAVDERMGALRETFQAQGFDLAQDGTPLVRDPKKVADLVAGFQQQPAAQADTEGEEEIPDSVTDPRAFNAWLERRDKRLEERILQAVTPRLEATDQFRLTQSERDAIERVKALVPGHDYLAELTATPENESRFVAAFRGVLRGSNWAGEPLSDDQLMTAASATIATVLPKKAQGRDDQGRFAGTRARNATLYASSHQEHPDGSHAPRTAPPTEEERELAGRYGMSVSRWRAMQEPGVTIDDFRRARAAEEKKGKK